MTAEPRHSPVTEEARSLEVRWIFPGQLETAVTRWFRPGRDHAARPGRPGRPPVPAGRAAGLRPVRAQAGISLVQRQARLPVPPRPRQRRHPGTWPAQERLCA